MNSNFFIFILSLLFVWIKPVAAFDAGDAIALILGLCIFFIGLCAFLGWWSRRTGAS